MISAPSLMASPCTIVVRHIWNSNLEKRLRHSFKRYSTTKESCRRQFIGRWPISGSRVPMRWPGTIDKSLSQYREFLTLWKNADPDLRILKQAQAEYATLSKPTP